MSIADANPYPWPYDGALDGDRLALVLVGVQTGWSSVSTGLDEARRCVLAATDAVTAVGGRLVLVRHGVPSVHRRTDRPPSVPLVGSDAWSVDESFLGDHRPLIVDSCGLDAFFGSPLDGVLRVEGRDHLVLAGCASELTVDTTVRGANDRGYECLILTDACAPVDPAIGARAHASVTMSGGIFGALATTADLVAALEPSAPLADTPPVPVA